MTAAERRLLAGSIDYAGLFPPASLGMADAVRNYAAYIASDDAWALGRLVVPAPRLDEMEHEVRALPSPGAAPWRLSVLIGEDVRGDVARLEAFHARRRERGDAGDRVPLLGDAVELRAGSIAEVRERVAAVPAALERFVEIPLTADVRVLVRAIGEGGAFAKARTGGTVRDAFPSAIDLAHFIRACVDESVPFKLTAGLHHPLRAEYRLTYAPGAELGTMFGFLNVFLAAAFAHRGMPEETLASLLEERDPASLRFAEDGVAWRDWRLDVDDIDRARAHVLRSFGSCSFREPVDELAALALPTPR